MAIVLAADILDSAIEKVRAKVQELFETTDTVAGMIKKGGEVEIISQKLYRIPLVQYAGGTYGYYDADGGDMGSGTGLKVIKVQAGFFDTRYTVEVSKRAMDTTATAAQATINAFAYNFKRAMKEVQVYDDITFHTDGTGKLTNSASATSTWSSGTKTTLTFAGASDTVGADRLRPGMVVDVYDTTGASKRAGGPYVIDHIDYKNKVVYFGAAVTAVAGTDLIAFNGLSATLASFQSTWPLSGDSARHGLYYANDDTTSNYFLGQLKSSATELLANSVDASSSGLSFAHGQQLLDQIIKRRDESAFKGLIGLAHMAQRAAVQNIGIAISNWFRQPGQKTLDLMPVNNEYSSDFEFCGVSCRVDKRQDKARFDFIIPKLWGRAQLHDTKFHDVQGRTVFESRVQATANLKAAVHYHIVQCYDFYTVDPGAQGYIKSLSVPSGY